MKNFDKFADKMSSKLLPVFTKLANQRDLAALRDGFGIILPLILAASFCILLNWVVFRPDSLLGAMWWPEGVPFFNEVIIPILNTITFAGVDIMAVTLTGSLSYCLVKSYKHEAIPAAVIAIACYLSLTYMQQDVTAAVEAAGVATSSPVMISGYINTSQLGSSNVFTAIIVGLSVGHIYHLFLDKGITIKMPSSVPPMVSSGFTAVVPGFVILLLWATIGFIFIYCGTDIFTFILTTLQKPFMNFSQGLIFGMLFQFFVQFLWFFGLHGDNILSPVSQAIYTTASIENMEAVVNGLQPQNILTSEFFAVYVNLYNLGIIIALFMSIKRQKNEHLETIAKLATTPAIFKIGEPIVFGLPQVLNPYIFIPMLIVGPICVFTAYMATAVGLIPPTTIMIPWVTPPIIGAFLATGGSWGATLMAAINLAIITIIYFPFIHMYNKSCYNQDYDKE